MFLAAALAAALTIHDYAALPSISAPEFSPDGKQIAYVVTTHDLVRSANDANLWLVDVDGRSDLQLTQSESTNDHPHWSPDGSKIAFLSDRDGAAALWMIDPRGGEAWKVTDTAGTVRDFAWSPDGKSIALLMIDPTTAEEERRTKERHDAHVAGAPRKQSHLYLVDVASRELRRLTRGNFSINTISWSPDGRLLAVERLPGLGLDDYYNADLFTLDASVACDDKYCPRMTPLVVRTGLDAAPHFSPDGKRVAFVSSGGAFGWLREHDIWIVDVATKRTERISAGYDRTLESMSWLDRSTLVFDGPLDTTSQLFRIAADGSGFVNLSKFEGVISNSTVAPATKSAAFVAQSLTAPPELYVAALQPPFAPRQLTHHSEEARNRSLGATRVIRWKNPKDGLEIEGLLTLPIGYRTGERVPLLTFVHGGPASRFDQGFLGYLGFLYPPQVFASKGFAVLRPNPRGTGGYGSRFRQANRNDWGGMDWIDINAGIDKLIADGIADPARLGLMGWSYGGFMASWAIGHSDRFKAISVGAPVVDLLSFHGTTDIRDFTPAYFAAEPVDDAAAPGDSSDPAAFQPLRHAPMSLDLLREHSPLWHLVPTKAHVLIQQGEADDRVPLSQGTMLYRMLEELGVHVSMVTYPRSMHVPREPKQRMDVMQRNLQFFEKWVK